MIFKLTVFLSLLAAAFSQSCNVTCIDVTLWDMFGDGWDGARLYVEFPDGSVASAAPTCEENPIVQPICGNLIGQYYMVNQLQANPTYIPKNYWEIFWTVEHDAGNSTGFFYTGGYNTTMVFDLSADCEWSLIFYENLWPNEDTCDACGDAFKCKKKKPKPKPSPPKSHKKLKKGNKDDEEEEENENNSTSNSTSIEGPRYGPPAVDVRVTMWDQEGDGWFLSDYHGANWYIADDTQTWLFYTGTLCDGFSGYCNLCLGDGSYTFRVTGEMQNFTSWDFCGVTGSYLEQLNFHVHKGKCHPDALVTLNTTCNGAVTSSVSVLGVIALTGIPTEMLDAKYGSVLVNTLGTEMAGWDVAGIQVLASALESRVLTNARALNSYTYDITFKASFYSEKSFGVDGRDYAAVSELVDTLSDKLNAKIASGEFVSTLVNKAQSDHVSSMSSVQSAELISLSLYEITYQGTEEFVYSTLTSEEESSSTYTVGSYNTTAIILFFAAIGFGFIAFVGVLSKGMTGYRSLGQDSQHGSFPVPEVMPAEMDQSVGKPTFSRFQTEKVEATI